MYSMELEPALSWWGTEDSRSMDMVLMSAKWDTVGSARVVTLLPRTPHGYSSVPLDEPGNARESVRIIRASLRERIGAR